MLGNLREAGCNSYEFRRDAGGNPLNLYEVLANTDYWFSDARLKSSVLDSPSCVFALMRSSNRFSGTVTFFDENNRAIGKIVFQKKGNYQYEK